jgi:ankyrin repeat protein
MFLQAAINAQNLGILKYLILESGADVNLKMWSGETPLVFACT